MINIISDVANGVQMAQKGDNKQIRSDGQIDGPKQADPESVLADLLDPNVAKTEKEWAGYNEIVRLRERLANAEHLLSKCNKITITMEKQDGEANDRGTNQGEEEGVHEKMDTEE